MYRCHFPWIKFRRETGMRESKNPTLRLLLACSRAHSSTEDESAIRQLLGDGIDWTVFVQKVLDHGLTGLAGHTLARLVPDMVPDDILNASQTFIDQTRVRNQVLLDDLAQLIDRLAAAG